MTGSFRIYVFGGEKMITLFRSSVFFMDSKIQLSSFSFFFKSNNVENKWSWIYGNHNLFFMFSSRKIIFLQFSSRKINYIPFIYKKRRNNMIRNHIRGDTSSSPAFRDRSYFSVYGIWLIWGVFTGIWICSNTESKIFFCICGILIWLFLDGHAWYRKKGFSTLSY